MRKRKMVLRMIQRLESGGRERLRKKLRINMVGVVARWCKWVSFLISFGGWCSTAWYGSVSDDGTACPQFAKNGLLSRRTHMMTRNIVNILPLSLISSH